MWTEARVVGKISAYCMCALAFFGNCTKLNLDQKTVNHNRDMSEQIKSVNHHVYI